MPVNEILNRLKLLKQIHTLFFNIAFFVPIEGKKFSLGLAFYYS